MITIFRNVREVISPYYTTVDKIVERIQQGNCRELVEQIRNEDDKKKQGELKAGLPSILFSGDFPNRKKDALPRTHSGLIILDIDDLGGKELSELSEIVKGDSFTLVSFVSPSGKGLKVLVKIPSDIKRHGGYFLGLEQYYQKTYGINLDPTGKNIGRVCYESFDPEIYYNEHSETFKEFIEPIQSKPKNSINNLDVFAIKSDDEIIERVHTWWVKNYDFNSGRNAAIFQLASALNRFGISQFSAESYCLKYEDHSRPKDIFDAKEIRRIVNNVYTHQSASHGTEIFEDNNKKQSVIDEILAADPEEAGEILQSFEGFEDFSLTELDDFAQELKEEGEKKKAQRAFWYYDDGKLKIDVHALITFINELGFFVYYPANVPNAYVFIKRENNIVRFVDEREIKTEVLNFVIEKKQNVVYNLISDRVKYWQRSFLNALPVADIPILRDDKRVSFIPTPSGVYKVTADNIEKIDYGKLTEGFVWESQITSKDFNYTPNLTGDFEKFINYVAGDKIERLKSIIGYMLHNYKDPSESKAVIFYDKNISQISGEPEGGSGKSLILEGIKHIRDVAPIHGDRVDFNKSFLFQEISESTQIAWIDELPQKADMSKFFSRVTNGLPVEKKNMTPIFIENEDAPKFVITTNYKPKGTSGSHLRRRIDFSVSNFFNHKNTPKMHFGKSFFTEWGDSDWNSFFTFYLDCLQFYLKNGIVKHDDSEDDYLTILSECGEEFTNFWINDGNLSEVKKYGEFLIRPYYEKLLDQYELTRYEYSIKKYLANVRKMFKLAGVKHTEEGARKQLKFTIHGN